MLSKEFLDYAALYIAGKPKEVLRESYGSINQGLQELYQIGVEIQFDEKRISPSELQKLYQKIQNTHGLNKFEDYETVDFLVCFELGFNHKIAPILEHRKKLKLLYGGLIYATHRFPTAAVIDKKVKRLITEEVIFRNLQKAQNARWAGDFNKCHQIIYALENNVSSSYLSRRAIQYWTANINDLKVEASFTIGDLARSAETLNLSEDSINSWGGQRDYIKLTHAYLRKAVLNRQLFSLENNSETPLFESIDTLREAEKEVAQKLMAQKNDQDAANTLVSLYCDLAKTYAQIKEFRVAGQYYNRAVNKLEQLDDLYSRRQIDLIRTKTIILSEETQPQTFYEINRLERGIEEMYFAIENAKRFHRDDFMLQELLAKDLIPLLAIIGKSGKFSYKEEAQRLFLNCQKRATELNLRHQQRGLKILANQFSFRL